MNEKSSGALGYAALAVFLALVALATTVFVQRLPGDMKTRAERDNKGNLGAIRSALSIYYGDNEGFYPSRLDALTLGGKYLAYVPDFRLAGVHPADSRVFEGPQAASDLGYWGYDNRPGEKDWGTLWIACTHTDARGTAWSAY